MPLYPETRTSCNDGKEIADYISAISLTSILKNILKSGHSSGISAELGPHQKRALVLMTWSAVGRGGEVKFQSFNEWNFDTGYEVLDIKWTEIKTLKKYSLLMVPDTRWLFDFYHCIGCYFAIENGLYRSEIAKKKGHLNVMFPVLYSIMDSQVAKKIGQILKNHLPKGTPKEVKNKISVKSLRCGGITLLSRHHEISDPRLCSRSGHSSGRNSDSYLDSSDLLLRLPGAMAMHGYKSLDSKISVYSLKMLPMDAVKRFIDEIFHISVPAFQPKGKLYVVTRICAASLIAHHRQVTADLGAGNTISKFLLAAARKAKIVDARYPNINPELLLEKWSEEVLESYVESNVDFTKSSPSAVGTAHALDEVKTMLSKVVRSTMFLEGELKQTRLDNAWKTAENSVLSERLGHLETQLRALHIEHLKTQKKLAFIKTPDHDIADKKRKNEDFEILDSCAPSSPKRLHFSDMSMDVLAAFTSPSHTHPLALPTTPQQTAKRSITTSISSGNHSDKKLGDAGVTLATCIMTLHQNNRLLLDKMWNSSGIKDYFKYPSDCKYSLNLADYVITQQQKAVLKSSTATLQQVMDTADNTPLLPSSKNAAFVG
ncbi:unnamed protein product [Cylindrotheca closterium]|uniref:Uncharacterized protein n=1 Tax=Cylindrotheca closterium TaxID=2856 RepID=A0AAD2FU35_9STRA|nr:unnamed protein product [Cylindrotheca closterium]